MFGPAPTDGMHVCPSSCVRSAELLHHPHSSGSSAETPHRLCSPFLVVVPRVANMAAVGNSLQTTAEVADLSVDMEMERLAVAMMLDCSAWVVLMER